MVNVLYDPLPQRWDGCRVNMGFRIGIQVFCVFEDLDFSDQEKAKALDELFFGEAGDDGEFYLRDHSQIKDFQAMLQWFVNGWCQDNPSAQKKRQKVMDYHKDQWRIYADFRKVYGIDLTVADLHWWEFCGLLWNMPFEQSSFLQVIDVRQKEFEKGMSIKAKRALMERKQTYRLDQPSPKLTKADEAKIDEFDRMMAERKGKADG